MEISVPGAAKFTAAMKWNGQRGPVLTGDCSKFTLLITNLSVSQPLNGAITLEMGLVSPTGWRASPTRTFRVDAGPGQEIQIPIPDDWMFVEGKVVYVLKHGSFSSTQSSLSIPLDHPLASFTVFERSTFHSDRIKTWTTLLLAAVAAVASFIAAAATLHWSIVW